MLTSAGAARLRQVLEVAEGEGWPTVDALRRLLRVCHIVEAASLPPEVATLWSRVRFRYDGRLYERSLIPTDRTAVWGGTISLAVPLGAALLGLRAGSSARLIDRQSRIGVVYLEAVPFRPDSGADGWPRAEEVGR